MHVVRRATASGQHAMRSDHVKSSKAPVARGPSSSGARATYPLHLLSFSCLASAALLVTAFAFPAPIHSAMDHSAHHHSGHDMSGHDMSGHSSGEHAGHTMAGMDHSGHSMGDGDMSMPMYFMNTWHTTLWFQSWETKSVNAYVLSLVGLVLLGVVHEALACYRSVYLSSGPANNMVEEPLVGVDSARPHRPRVGREKLWASVLYAGNIATGYLLMLAVMTFNTGYFFAVIAGMALGYYLLFDYTSRTSLTRTDSCHPRLDTHA